MRNYLIIAAGTFLSLSVASNALAADCDADVVLVRGSSASQKLIEAVASVAATQGIKIVYSSNGSSCAGGVYEAVTDPSVTTGRAASANTAYDPAAPTATCTFATPRAADIGVSDVYPSSCAGLAGLPTTTLPANVTDTLGPVQAFTLAVYDDPGFPVAISAEAAFNTFGITARGGDASFAVTPWTVPADIFGRAEDSGTWQTWSRNLGLVTQKPVSAPQTGSGAVLAALNTANRSSAIGIIALNDIVASGGVAPKVRPLAFKAKGQDFAYYPSSTSSATDMINVRDGHYQTWANLHFFARKDAGGDYSAKVKTVLGLVDSQPAVAAVAKIRAVPSCAMQVSRAADGGDFSLYTPAKPCGCFFEASASGTAPASCTTCKDDATCGASGQCVFGYCEAK
ncbi:MAG: hypothetical protein JWP97_4244 [Labilithrix sp.]|nr:hypothetical protein [Labilithrix sp.]